MLGRLPGGGSRLPGGGAHRALVAVVLQLVEGANAGAALLHDAALLRGPLQGRGLQAAGTRASTQLHGPHCGERRSGRRRSPAHPARPWSGTPNRCPGAHHGPAPPPPPPHNPPRTGPSPRVTGRLPQAPPSPTHHPETMGTQDLTHFRRFLPGAALGGEGREWGQGAGRGRGEKGGGEGRTGKPTLRRPPGSPPGSWSPLGCDQEDIIFLFIKKSLLTSHWVPAGSTGAAGQWGSPCGPSTSRRALGV